MHSRVIASFVTAFVLSVTCALADTTFTVDTVLGEWTDTARADRVVPYKIYLPREALGARAIVVFSHGLGGNRDGAEYLLDHLAAHGYAAVAVQHHGSDAQAVFGDPDGWKQAISPAVAIERFRDIPFAIDALEKMNASDAKLRGRLDLTRIGMSGHSYGAITTMALAGQSIAGGRISFGDPRLKAAIAYSPSKPQRAGAEAFTSVLIPTFHMTGTDDKNPLDANDPASTRLFPYRSITNGDKFLLIFSGGDHMVFSGRDFRGQPRPNDPRFHALIQKASLAYWDAYLLDKAEAKSYLTSGAFARDLAADGTFEFRLR